MKLIDFINEMRPAIDQSIQSVFDRHIPEPYAEMKHILNYQLGWEGEGAGLKAQGKRIRPLLLLLCTAAAGGEWINALPAAASVELLHNFSLIHDDIQDRSKLRRSRPTVWVQWGEALAINGGDLMFTLSQLAMLDLRKNIPPQRALEAAAILNRTCIQLTGGQHLDISYEKSRFLSMDLYWPMITGKTAALLECCCEIAAVIARAEKPIFLAFSQFGKYLGLAFQVLDDYLGIWGNAALIGKSIESDLVSGKKSLPVVYGLQKCGRFHRRWMDENPIDKAEIADLAGLLVEEGAKEYTLQVANQLTKQALDALNRATIIKNDASEGIVELANQLLERTK